MPNAQLTKTPKPRILHDGLVLQEASLGTVLIEGRIRSFQYGPAF